MKNLLGRGNKLLRKTIKKKNALLATELEIVWNAAQTKIHHFQEGKTSQGTLHCLSVENNVGLLLQDKLDKFKDIDLFILSAAAALHDIGKIKVQQPKMRLDHGQWGKELLLKREISSEFFLDDRKAIAVAEIIGVHYNGRIMDLPEEPFVIRWPPGLLLRSLAAIFRLADMLDTDYRRCPYVLQKIKSQKFAEDPELWLARGHIGGWDFGKDGKTLLLQMSSGDNKDRRIAKTYVDILNDTITESQRKYLESCPVIYWDKGIKRGIVSFPTRFQLDTSQLQRGTQAQSWETLDELLQPIHSKMSLLFDQIKSIQEQMAILQTGVHTRVEEKSLKGLRKQYDSLTKKYGALKGTIDTMKAIGLQRILTRAELEVSDISFANVVNLLKDEDEEKEFFVLGKTLEFISRQMLTLEDGLKHGIHFMFSLVSPTPQPWDTEYMKSIKEKARNSIEKFRKLLIDPDPSWKGTLELRKTRNPVENSFSSFVYRGRRISVMDFDLGEDLNLQCSQVFTHKKGERNLAFYLYLLNKDKYKRAQFVLAYPSPYKVVYVYGLKNSKIVFVRKKGRKTWELPGGKIRKGEIPEETAKREFLEETGYTVDIFQSIESKESKSLAFIGKVGKKITDKIDTKEIEEIKFMDQVPEKATLTFPHTGYEKILLKISEYLH